MGTAQLAFEGENWGATGSPVPEVTRSHVTGSVFCACTNGSWSISALLGPFYLLIGSDVTGSGRNWMYVLRMPGFFPRYFFLTRVPWLPNVTNSHLTPSGSVGCWHVQPEVTHYPPLTGNDGFSFCFFKFFSVFFCFFFNFFSYQSYYFCYIFSYNMFNK